MDSCRVRERAITALVCRLESISRLLTVVRRGREWKKLSGVWIAFDCKPIPSIILIATAGV